MSKQRITKLGTKLIELFLCRLHTFKYENIIKNTKKLKTIIIMKKYKLLQSNFPSVSKCDNSNYSHNTYLRDKKKRIRTESPNPYPKVEYYEGAGELDQSGIPSMKASVCWGLVWVKQLKEGFNNEVTTLYDARSIVHSCKAC